MKIIYPKINLLIIGAQKCGTTTLYSLLASQKGIWMSKVIKEPGYFLPWNTMYHHHKKNGLKIKSKEDLLANYMMSGYKNESWVGEASTFYSTFEWGRSELVDEIWKYNPDMKIIYILRDPVDRIVSHYFHSKKSNDDLLFNEFLVDNSEVFNICKYQSRIKPYVDKFGQENILILQFEKLVQNKKTVLKELSTFLNMNVKSKFKLPHLNKNKFGGDTNYDIFEKIIKSSEEWSSIKDECSNILNKYITIESRYWAKTI